MLTKLALGRASVWASRARLRAIAAGVAAAAWSLAAAPAARAGDTSGGASTINEQPVVVAPGTLGLIRASASRGLLERREPGGMPLASSVGVQNSPGCNTPLTYAGQVFTGGTYAMQAGMVEGEWLAAVFYFDPADGPVKLRAIEQIFLTRNTIVATTTKLRFVVWNGLPAQSSVAFSEDTDGSLLPHLTMPAGTNGTNYRLEVDPNDPDQFAITGESVFLGGQPKQRFSVGIQIIQHHAQGGIDPCTQGPNTSANAFPATDNTRSICGNYTELQSAANNWLFGINCGPLGCPTNGGWTNFSGLLADPNISGGCLTGCRPRGDWMLRVTFDTAACVPGGGACCFPNGACGFYSPGQCSDFGGDFQGEGSNCADTPCAAPSCLTDYNRDGQHNLDDLGDFITDYYIEPAIPGGLEFLAPTTNFLWVGYGWPCETAGDAPPPYDPAAYRQRGFRVAFAPGGGPSCPLAPEQNFPNLDNLGDFVTAYYANIGRPGCQ